MIVVSAACLPALANAAERLQCQAAVISPPQPSEDYAESAWKTTVTQSLGASWANFGLARNKRYDDINLALAILYTVSAQPCRPWIDSIGKITPPNRAFKFKRKP